MTFLSKVMIIAINVPVQISLSYTLTMCVVLAGWMVLLRWPYGKVSR